MREDQWEALEKVFPDGFIIIYPNRDGLGIFLDEKNSDLLADFFDDIQSKIITDVPPDEQDPA